MILLDTSLLSRILRRHRPGPEEQRLRATFERLVAADMPMGLPGVVLQEILSGVRSADQFEELRARLINAFPIVLATVGDHIEAARLRNTCTRNGTNVSGIDCLIAITTIAGGHELFTTDDDFRAIARHAPLRLFEPDRPG